MESNSVRFTVAVWEPLVPVITKLKGFGELTVRPLRVNVLLVPETMVVGLKLQVWFDGHDNAMLPVKLVALEAVMV